MNYQKEKLTIIFTVLSERIKYLGINLTKRGKDPFSENCEALVKGTEGDINRWKDITFVDWKN